MKNMPTMNKVTGGVAWSNTFEKFKATVYVPAAKADLQSEILNYGFIAPYLLVFAEKDFTFEEIQSKALVP